MTYLTRQTYVDEVISAIDTSQHPLVQLKYDGIWCHAYVQPNTVDYISRNGQIKYSEPNPGISPGSYIGEYMFGSEWAQQENLKGRLFLFDYLGTTPRELINQPYHFRISTLQSLPLLPTWSIIETFDSREKDNIWTLLVDTGHFEGLVFRSPNQLWHTTLVRSKNEVTVDLPIVGFQEGEGRLKGTVGAIICEHNGITHIIGGGLKDSLRQKMWNNPQQYIGRWIRVTAKKIFQSGQLRHPNFHSFHDDK